MFPHCVNHGHKPPLESSNGKKPFLAAVKRWRYDMRRIENDIGIEKIEAVLFDIGKPLSFVPFIAHGYYVHILCLHVKGIKSKKAERIRTSSARQRAFAAAPHAGQDDCLGAGNDKIVQQ